MAGEAVKFFCRHQWVEKERFCTYANITKTGRMEMSEHLMQQLLQGVTTILYRCSQCTSIKTIEILGSEQQTVSGKPGEVKL